MFLDVAKAFDTVDHDIPLSKLQDHFGSRGKPLEQIWSYLFDRYQYTKIFNINLKTIIFWEEYLKVFFWILFYFCCS